MGLMFEILFLVFLMGASDEPKVSLSLQPQEQVGPIYLKNLIKAENIPQSFLQTIEDSMISSSSDEWNSLSTLDVLKKIKSLFSEYEDDCRCRIQWTVLQSKIVKENERFSLEAFQKILKEKLQNACEDCQHTLSSTSIVRGQIPEQYETWEIEADAQKSRGPSMIRVYFDRKALDPLVLQTHIRIYKPVAVLKRPVRKGELVDKNLLHIEMQEITNEKRPLVEVAMIEGKEFKRSLSQGHWLSMEDVEGRQNVRLGQPVIVEVQTGSIKIEMSGVAQRDGKMGERIPIRVIKTQKQIMGEVIADARVRL